MNTLAQAPDGNDPAALGAYLDAEMNAALAANRARLKARAQDLAARVAAIALIPGGPLPQSHAWAALAADYLAPRTAALVPPCLTAS